MKMNNLFLFILIVCAIYLMYDIYRIYHDYHDYHHYQLESFSNSLSIISCYFGDNFSFLHQAPSNFKCYFFTNNLNMKNEIEKKGWIYRERKEEISSDILVSSIQSKKIKFLQIIPEYPEIFDGKDILYIDHKIEFTNEHVDYVQTLSNKHPDTELILCKHNQVGKKTITDEIRDALHQERYSRHMPETIEFVNRFLEDNQLKDNTPIYLTGILYFHNISKIKPLLHDVYHLCNDLQQPECQIFMSTLGQKYENYIKSIDFIEINPSLNEATH